MYRNVNQHDALKRAAVSPFTSGQVGMDTVVEAGGVIHMAARPSKPQHEVAWHLARLEEVLVQNGSAYCRIYGWEEGSLSLTDDVVRAWGYTIPGYYSLTPGTTVRIEWHGSIEGWFVTGVYY